MYHSTYMHVSIHMRVKYIGVDVYQQQHTLTYVWLNAGPELHGVLHAGGVVRDATIPKQTAAGFREVLGPKAQGASVISSSCRCAPMVALKLFSSIAARLGSGGQANYAAANAVMDGLAASLQIQVHSPCFAFHDCPFLKFTRLSTHAPVCERVGNSCSTFCKARFQLKMRHLWQML